MLLGRTTDGTPCRAPKRGLFEFKAQFTAWGSDVLSKPGTAAAPMGGL